MRHLTGILCLILLLFSCRDRVICPAFQSTYILDDSVRIAYFSYIWKLDEVDRIKILEQRNAEKDSIAGINIGMAALSDTTDVNTEPQKSGVDYYAYVEDIIVPPREVKKTRYGIIKYEPYWLKNYHLKTAPMENILTPEPEEEDIPPLADEEMLADLNSDSTLTVGLADTTGIAMVDSTGVPTSDVLAKADTEKEKGPRFLYRYDPNDNFNVEQVYYNKWYGRQLIYQKPPPKPEIAPLASDSVVTDVEPIDPANLQNTEQDALPPADNQEQPVETTEPQEQEPVEQAPPPPPSNEPVIQGQDDNLGF